MCSSVEREYLWVHLNNVLIESMLLVFRNLGCNVSVEIYFQPINQGKPRGC